MKTVLTSIGTVAYTLAIKALVSLVACLAMTFTGAAFGFVATSMFPLLGFGTCPINLATVGAVLAFGHHIWKETA